MCNPSAAPQGAGAPDENDPLVRAVARMLSEWNEGDELAREFATRLVNFVQQFGPDLKQQRSDS